MWKNNICFDVLIRRQKAKQINHSGFMAFLQHLPRFERLPGQSNASKIIENRGDEDRGNTEQGTIRPEDVMRPWTVAAKFLFSSFGCLWSAQVYVIPYTWVPMALANLFSCFFSGDPCNRGRCFPLRNACHHGSQRMALAGVHCTVQTEENGCYFATWLC